MKLTDTYIRSLKPKAKRYKSRREAGLFVWVMPSASKLWYLGYTFAGKERALSIGAYPAVTIADARERRIAANKLLAKGIDPSEHRKAEKLATSEAAANTFTVWAESWYAAKVKDGWAAATAAKARFYLDADLLPALGLRSMVSIRRKDLVQLLRAIEDRGAHDVAKKCRGWLSGIFKRALVAEIIDSNPATDLDVVAAKGPKRRPYPHISEQELPDLLRALEIFSGAPETRCALQMLLLTAVRSGELRGMRWCEVDMDSAAWNIPAERMKMRRSHVVPLPAQAMAILEGMKAVTGARDLVFPSPYRPRQRMSDATLNLALARLGYKGRQVAHGFRHLISTALNERGYNRDWIEVQLAHGDENQIRAVYNGARYVAQRRQMMQAWADELDSMRSSNKVTPLRAA